MEKDLPKNSPQKALSQELSASQNSEGKTLAPPTFNLQANALQKAATPPVGRGTCTQYGDYWIVPDDTKVCYVGVVGEQITETEFKKLSDAWGKLKDGTGNIAISEKDSGGKDHAGFKDMVLGQLGKLMSKPVGRGLVVGLINATHKVTIMPTATKSIASATRGAGSLENADGTANTGGTSTIMIDADLTDDAVVAFDKAGKEIPSPVFVILGHELIHAKHNDEGRNRRSLAATDAAFGNREEEETISTGSLTENNLRTEHGIALRHGHSGKLKP